MAPHASFLVRFGLIALSLSMVTAVGLAIGRWSSWRDARRYALAVSLWLGVSGALAAAGFFAVFDGFPPRVLLLMLPTFALPLGLAFSRVGERLASAPVALLVASQAFRLPLELVMHRAASEGVMPVQMSYGGYNFDIVTGSTAVLVAALSAFGYAPRWLLLAWNALGTALLCNILTIAVASLPLVRAFGDDPSRLNTWIAYFPYVWLPAALVSAAVLGHSLLWRRLLSHAMRGRAFASVS